MNPYNPFFRPFHIRVPGSAFIYQPLNHARREIRLLEIEPNSESLSCKLHVVSLDTEPRYTALSYVWGDSTSKEDIIVNGSTIPVTKNLRSALQHIRKLWQTSFPERSPSEMRIWADAICINQHDLAERSSQVMIMDQVYSSSEQVMAWLGSEDEQVPLALETLNLMAHKFRDAGWNLDTLSSLRWLAKIPSLLETGQTRPHQNARWEAISFLNRLPYWRRVWTFQEQALAPSLIFFCPSTSVHGFEIFEACLTFSNLRLRPLERPGFVSDDIWFYIAPFNQRDVNQVAYIKSVAQLRQLMLTSNLDVDRGRENSVLEVKRLLYMLEFPFNATDPKDHIYGVLGLLSPRLASRLVVDYSSSTTLSDVYVQFTSMVMDELQRLDIHPLQILYSAGTERFGSDSDLPTWVPNFPEASKVKRWPMWAKYNRFEGLNPITIPKIRGSVLSVTGVQSLRVSKLGPTMMPFLCEENKPLLIDFLDEQKKKFGFTQELFRAVMMISNERYKCDIGTYGLACEFIFHVRHFLGESSPQYIRSMAAGFEALADCFPPQFEFNDENLEVWGLKVEEMSLSVASSLMIEQPLRVFQTEEGLLGIGPECVRVGDVICYLNGFPSLTVLRKAGSGYRFIGPCNVVHNLERSTINSLISMRIEPKTFEIV